MEDMQALVWEALEQMSLRDAHIDFGPSYMHSKYPTSLKGPVMKALS